MKKYTVFLKKPKAFIKKLYVLFIFLLAGIINCTVSAGQDYDLANNLTINKETQEANLSGSGYIWSDACSDKSLSPIQYDVKDSKVFCIPTVSGFTVHYLTSVSTSINTVLQ